MATSARLRTRCGWVTPHSMARCPPSEAPMTRWKTSIPRASARRASASTASRVVSHGKRDPQGRPSGAVDDGPVEPWQPPRMLAATTK